MTKDENRSALSKRSHQQDVVRSSIMDRFDHPTAEQVYMKARQKCPKISLATVYRNLDKLVNEGVVNKFTVQGEPDHYDPVRKEHYHVYCTNCGRILDIDIEMNDKLSKLIRKQTGVLVNSIQLLAKGFCKDCVLSNEKGEG